MGKLDLKDAGFNIGVNVKITKRDKYTGKILETRENHNRCLRYQLLGMAKFLNGEFNRTATEEEQDYYHWVPRYLGVGTNIAGSSTSSVGTEVNINDTMLLNEISPRLKLPDRNKIVSRSTQSYIQLVIDTYLPSQLYNGNTIAEAGLFADETGNNCLFRITFSGITKDENSVIQVSWIISIISIASENEPYVDVDKTDLKEILDEIFDKIGTMDSRFTTICNDLKLQGIPTYASNTVMQDDVDEVTQLLTQDYNNLDN